MSIASAPGRRAPCPCETRKEEPGEGSRASEERRRRRCSQGLIELLAAKADLLEEDLCLGAADPFVPAAPRTLIPCPAFVPAALVGAANVEVRTTPSLLRAGPCCGLASAGA